MKMCVQTGGISRLFGMEKGLTMIHDAGFDGVDLNLNGYLPGKDIKANNCNGFFTQPEKEILTEAERLKDLLDKNHLEATQAHAPFPSYVADSATNEHLVDIMKKTIHMCGVLNCRNLVIHPAFLPYELRLTVEEEHDANISFYTALIPTLKEENVTACLENMFGHNRGKLMVACCSDFHQACTYVDELNEIAGQRCFGFCLDTGHANLLGQDQYDIIRQLGNRLQVLHVHDNNGVVDEHLFPYMGITPWDRFLRGLKEIDYKGDLSFETFHGIDTFDPELAPQLLNLLAATGRMFIRRIEA